MKPRFLVIFLSALLLAASAVHPVWAVEPNTDLKTYYAAINGKAETGDALRTTLCTIISTGYTSIGYSSLADNVYAASTDPSDFYNGSSKTMEDIYSSKAYTSSDGKSSATDCGQGWNKEHTVPQSWFGEASPMKSDAHHVFPTDTRMNSNRSSYPYGENNAAKYCSSYGYGQTGASTRSDYSGTVYDPGSGGANGSYKGDLARVYFYMVTRYRTTNFTSGTGNTSFTYSNGVANLTSYMLKLMLEWHAADPVSEKEQIRNNAIYTHQKNRNPYVDYPELVDYVFGDKKTTAVVLDDLVSSYETGSLATPTLAFTYETLDIAINTTQTNVATTNSDATVTYHSSNTSVATVSSSGVITGVAAGTATITASVAKTATYAARSVTCPVTVYDPADMCNVYWIVEGDYDNPFDSNVASRNSKPTLPSDEPECTDKVFVGWTPYSSSFDPATGPTTLFKTAEEADDVTNTTTYYYAVFATASLGTGNTNGTKTFTFSEIAEANNWVNGTAYTTVTDDPVTISATGGGNNGKWYTSNSSWRMYSGGTVVISVDGGDVTSVSSSPTCSFTIDDSGTYATASYSPSARTDFTKITVNYTTTGSTPTYSDYSFECSSTPCTKLSTPNVTAVPGDKKITLTWPAVEDAVSYNVVVDNGAGFTTECLSAPTVGTVTINNGICTCIISDLTNGLAYTTRVEAVASNTSCNSNIDEDTVTPSSGCQATVTVTTDHPEWGSVSVQ